MPWIKTTTGYCNLRNAINVTHRATQVPLQEEPHLWWSITDIKGKEYVLDRGQEQPDLDSLEDVIIIPSNGSQKLVILYFEDGVFCKPNFLNIVAWRITLGCAEPILPWLHIDDLGDDCFCLLELPNGGFFERGGKTFDSISEAEDFFLNNTKERQEKLMPIISVKYD